VCTCRTAVRRVALVASGAPLLSSRDAWDAESETERHAMAENGESGFRSPVGERIPWIPQRFGRTQVCDGANWARRPSTGKARLSSLSLGIPEGVRRPSTAGPMASPLLFSGSLANSGRFGFRRTGVLQAKGPAHATDNAISEQDRPVLKQGLRQRNDEGQLNSRCTVQGEPIMHAGAGANKRMIVQSRALSDVARLADTNGSEARANLAEALRSSLISMQALPDQISETIQAFEDILASKVRIECLQGRIYVFVLLHSQEVRPWFRLLAT
jgi:hypothetical protein